jgi:hypothetical protein
MSQEINKLNFGKNRYTGVSEDSQHKKTCYVMT